MAVSTQPGPDDVRAYYDEFLRYRMTSYRIDGNPRIEAAISRILPLLRDTDRVLDVGCGIGIVSERLARRVTAGKVHGIDISPMNIWYAERTTRAGNLSFASHEAVNELDAASMELGGPADVVVLVDSIEHIPEADRPGFLRMLRGISSDSALLVITYPSPQYQRYLRENNPGELQVIDNSIELATLVEEAASAGYLLRHYSLECIWRPGDYCHVILQAGGSDCSRPLSQKRKSMAVRAVMKAESVLLSRIIRRYRQWRYVDRVFRRIRDHRSGEGRITDAS